MIERATSSPLVNRLLKMISLCALVYLLIILAIIIPRGLHLVGEQKQELEQKLALSLSNSASIALYVNNYDIASEVMDALLLHKEINAVKLVGVDGVVFERTSVVQTAKDHNFWEDASQYHLTSPVDGNLIGHLMIHEDHQVIRQQAINQILDQIAVVMIQFLVTFVALIWIVRRLVGKPLTELSEALSEVRPDHDRKVTVAIENKYNEIGLVAESINEFIDASHQALIRERELRQQIERWENYYRIIAEQDTLSGLKNRLGCEKYVLNKKRSSSIMVLLLIDLDGFKQVNDTLGHAAGDDVLREIAKRFLSLAQARFSDSVVGRLGGDEFAIYIPIDSFDSSAIEEFAMQLIQASSTPIILGKQSTQVGCSIGISYMDCLHIDLEKLLLQADKAMYWVKHRGKHNYHIYSAGQEVRPLPSNPEVKRDQSK
ncbi:sensor domain-containing diguanylate cyclase [Vibrio mimicus]|uniref:sensor domain-containing diguanylate cyclase n=1 Tax=Vibrio mimicus TaxID=674 RepID=UPI0011D4BE9B|nr:sensor domain-containing diguanylate cyclase [Vibrio mimicus]TXY45410.1 diguanylate cyclase [Vibrio mimicus]